MSIGDQAAFARAYAAHERLNQVANYRIACVLGIIFMPAGVTLDWFVYHEQVPVFLASKSHYAACGCERMIGGGRS